MSDPSQKANPQAGSRDELEGRVRQLENQVKGLTETMNSMYTLLMLERRGVPRPDQYMQDQSTTATTSAPVGKEAVTSQSTAEYMGQKMAKFESKRLAMLQSKGQKAASTPPSTFTPESLAKADPYAYAPLKSGSAEVRVLAMNASSDDDAVIECELLVLDLAQYSSLMMRSSETRIAMVRGASKENFTALSYTWGTGPQCRPIAVDGKKLLITDSLHKALQHFRKISDNLPPRFGGRRMGPFPKTFWWIDYICINQADLEEKSRQVALMTKLYRSAIMVHVWLGEEADDSKKAMHLIRHFGYKPRTMEDIATWEYIRQPGQTTRPAGPGQDPVKLPDELVAESEDERQRNCLAIIALFNRPWFRRVWIRQEVALPGSVAVHCGDEQCTWGEFVLAASCLHFVDMRLKAPDLRMCDRPSDTTMGTCFELPVALDDLRRATSTGSKYIPFADLVFHSRNCLATDPRDKVYAMLPLTNPDEIPVVADYQRSVPEAYEAAVVHLLSKSLNFLAACQAKTASSLALPSWVPDFSASWTASPLWPYLGRDYDNLDSGDFRKGAPQVEYDAQSHTLSVLGVLVDEIDRFCPSRAAVSDTDADLHALISTWWDFSNTSKQSSARPAGHDSPATAASNASLVVASYAHSVWNSMCLNFDWDNKVSRRRDDSDDDYAPMRRRAVVDDPRLRRVANVLLKPTYRQDLAESFEAVEREGTRNVHGRIIQAPLAHFRRMALGRRFAMSSAGLACLVPDGTQIGDLVAFVKGSKDPLVIRRRGQDEWTMVGETYLMSIARLQEPISSQMIKLV